MKFEAILLRDRKYAVRPEGAVGACGERDGILWQVVYVRAASPEQAIRRARKMHWWIRDAEASS